MINNKKISLVIPCRNEAHGIARLLLRVPSVVDEVIVVDNNSSDATVLTASLMGARVIAEGRVDSRGIGYGYALQTGMRQAAGDYIVTMDGDGTYPVEQIEELVSFAMRSKHDVVVGSRFPLTHDQAISWVRKMGIWVLNTAAFLLYEYQFSDLLSGMWVVKRTKLKKLDLNEGGWNLSLEMKLESLAKLSFGEYPVNHHRREHELSKQRLFQTGWDHLWYLLIRKFGIAGRYFPQELLGKAIKVVGE